jgi:hypothetical protein
MSATLMPITKAEFDEGKKKIFTDAIADKVGVLKRQVVVTGVSAHGAAAASLRRRRLLGAAAAGTGIDVQLLVEDLPMAKAQTVAASLNSLFTDTGAEGIAGILTAAGVNVKSCVVTDKASVDGPNKPKDGCVAAVMEEVQRLAREKTPPAKWPESMRSYCLSAFEKKKNHLRVNAQIVKRTCERGFGIFQRIPESERLAKATSEAKSFCFEMRHFFEELVRSKGAQNTTHGMATSVAEINRQQPGQGVTACCVPHMSPGCFDKKIQECVAAGNTGTSKQKDSFCSDTEWDLTCTENVEFFKCAGCPQPEFLEVIETHHGPIGFDEEEMDFSDRDVLAEPEFWIGA